MMAGQHILIVEDEADVLELLRYNLSREGFRVTGVGTSHEALDLVKHDRPDLIALDLMLPDLDGRQTCVMLKGDPDTRDIPIVMITALGDETDIIVGLGMGADDYITKPFNLKVTIARLRTLLRRQSISSDDDNPIKIHQMVIKPRQHELWVEGKRIELRLSEFRILCLLAKRPGWVFSRQQIIDSLHGQDHPVTERSVDVQVVGLRRKLGDVGHLIETIRGIGYRLSIYPVD